MLHVSLFRIPNPVFLTPRNRNLSQCVVTIPIPIIRNAILVIYRVAETLHNAVLMDIELRREGEVVEVWS